MKTTIGIKSILFLPFILMAFTLHAQVKTKIYDYGIPAHLVPLRSPVVNEIPINTPAGLDDLVALKESAEDKKIEYDNKFAIPQPVDIDFFKSAKIIETKNEVQYFLTINAFKALNISAQFKNFNLSPHAVLSIYTENELTDSITAKENNENKIWATRVYQGSKLNILVKIPVAEKDVSSLTISQVSFGYKKIGIQYFGSPGSSASCNINVLCPQGSGWQGERSSVVFLLVADGAGTCTGSMINNTCNANTPYLLTANHCLGGNLNNWVFQYQYWSTTCTPNTGGREDIQFNGCTLRANNAATDFALVELNTTPPANSGISYAGWNRSSTAAANTVEIHHPASDLMKISLDANPPVAISWPGISGSTHWRAHFQQGTVQPGSSGSPLFDENHRIIGQCHGDQNNAGNYCSQQISECGRFDLSWTGGGTNATRLSNWLDPNNSGAMTTNTTDIVNLALPLLSLSITGGDNQICTGSSTYTLNGAPAGSTITWSISNTGIASLSSSGNSATVTKTGNGDLSLTATVSNGNTNLCYPNSATKTIKLGSYANYEVQISGYTMIPTNYPTSYSVDLGKYNITNLVWSWPSPPTYNAPYAWTYLYGGSGNYYVALRAGSSPSTGSVNLSFTSCGVNNILAAKWVAWGYGGPMYRISPNPSTSGFIKIEQIDNETNKVLAQTSIQSIEILDKTGFPVYKSSFAKGIQNGITIPVGNLMNGTYTVRIFDGKEWKSTSLVILH